jgi:hypothetical protein
MNINQLIQLMTVMMVLGMGMSMPAMLQTRKALPQSLWLTPSQREDLEKKYGSWATRYAEEMARVGDLEMTRKIAAFAYEKFTKVFGE